jgi:hypothetical protein
LLVASGNHMPLRAQSIDDPGLYASGSTEFGSNPSPPDSARSSTPDSGTTKPDGFLSSSESSNVVNAGSVMLAKPAPPPERFHFWPAMLQSFEFTMVSHAFRIADDPGMQYDLAHLPFFHNWLVSYKGYNLERWGDGDDFIVNDVGHPLQGAVFSRIFLQNSPRGRGAVIGKNRAYWISRLNGMAWAAVWEVQWKVGPFSETSFGDAGGFVYVPGCGIKVSCLTNPAYHKPATNNTGLTDWVMTPLGGMLWVMGEDTLEKYVVEPVAHNHRILGGRVLRAMLEPSKDFAALFMGKLVWQLPNAENNYTMPTKPPRPQLDRGNEARPPLDHWEIGTQYTNVSLPVVTRDCLNCRQYNSGMGLNFDWNPTRGFGFDSSVNLLPGQGGASPMIEGLFGVKMGHRWNSWGLFGKIRPGFIYYDKAVAELGQTNTTSLTRFATDFGAIAEVYPSRNSTLRFDVGTTLVRYLTDRRDAEASGLGNLLANEIFVNQCNFQMSTGYVYRF